MKYYIHLLLLSTLLNYCSKESSNKNLNSEISVKFDKKKEDSSNYDLKLYNNSNCKIITQDQDVILYCGNQQLHYKNLIVNEMSISTDFIQDSDNSFSLIYDLNASDTKIKEKYSFTYSPKGIKLLFKEVVKLSRDGLSINKLYFNNYLMKGNTYDNIQSLGSGMKDIYNSKVATGYLFDTNMRIFAKEVYHSNLQDLFIDYPKTKKITLEIINVEIANNQAYALQQDREFNISRNLLENITQKDPTRVVAWLNLADTYWELFEKAKAKVAYQKYIYLMKSQNKDLSKIPQRVYERSK